MAAPSGRFRQEGRGVGKRQEGQRHLLWQRNGLIGARNILAQVVDADCNHRPFGLPGTGDG